MKNKRGKNLTDSGHASGRDGVNTRAEVLDNGASATLDGKDTSDLQDNV
jgi:hypothetical protein